MDDLAHYFSNIDDHVDIENPEEFCQRKCTQRLTRHAYPRPVSIHFTSGTNIHSSSFPGDSKIDAHSCGSNDPLRTCDGQQMCLQNSRSLVLNSPMMPNDLPPEVEFGNIEYKRKLVNPTPNRFEHLVTQMKWRLNEGGGEAIYRLGVDDNGHITGLAPVELASSLSTLERMAARLNATVHLLREKTVEGTPIFNSCQNNLPGGSSIQSHKAMELLVRQTPFSNHGKPTVCIAVLGAVDVGKSTLIGVLTDGELDNARGRARLNLFRHLHEVQSGRTSCLSSELLGFDSAGSVTNYKRTDGRLDRSSIDEFIRSSSELVTLLDSAGHSKYQRTTLAGLARAFPVGVLLVVSATAGLTAIGLDHAQLAHSLGLPVAVVISKIDQLLTDADRSRQVASICRQVSLRFSQLKQSLPGKTKKDTLAAPLFFPVSAVTGEGLEDLLRFLNAVGRSAHVESLSHHMQSPQAQTTGGLQSTASSMSNDTTVTSEELFTRTVCQLVSSATTACHSPFMCFWVCEVFTCVLGVPDPILFGIVKSGQLMVGHVAWLGPDQVGEFHLVQIMSLHHNRQPHSVVYAGQTASVAVHFLVSLGPSTGRATDLEESTPSGPHVEKRRNSGLESGFPDHDENDENVPKGTAGTTFTFPHDTLLPMTLRRGMVLLSNTSWSSSYMDMMGTGSAIPLRLPHMSVPGQSVGVAWTVEVELVHQLSVFPGVTTSPVVIPPLPIVKQKVAFYAGSVAQPVVVTVEPDLLHAPDENPRLQLRFTRFPEYIEVGRQCIISWASCAKAVGRVSKVLDLLPSSSSLLRSIPYWINCRARLEIPIELLPSAAEEREGQRSAFLSIVQGDDPSPPSFSTGAEPSGTRNVQSPQVRAVHDTVSSSTSPRKTSITSASPVHSASPISGPSSNVPVSNQSDNDKHLPASTSSAPNARRVSWNRRHRRRKRH